MMKKPPLGLTPKSIHDWQRKIEILNVMGRYAADDKYIPQEWIDELVMLNQDRAQPQDSTDSKELEVLPRWRCKSCRRIYEKYDDAVFCCR